MKLQDCIRTGSCDVCHVMLFQGKQGIPGLSGLTGLKVGHWGIYWHSLGHLGQRAKCITQMFYTNVLVILIIIISLIQVVYSIHIFNNRFCWMFYNFYLTLITHNFIYSDYRKIAVLLSYFIIVLFHNFTRHSN